MSDILDRKSPLSKVFAKLHKLQWKIQRHLKKPDLVLRGTRHFFHRSNWITRWWMPSYATFCEQANAKAKLANPDFKERSIALMTVLIVRENILFLEEWIEHHLQMGVDHIYLYDNSKVQEKKLIGCGIDPTVPGQSNNYLVNYADLISVEETSKRFEEIQKKYADCLTVLPWERRNENGTLGYFQHEAIFDFITKYKYVYDYGLFTDVDEFLISRNNQTLKDIVHQMENKKMTTAFFKDRLFHSRFSNLDKKVREIKVCDPFEGNKLRKSLLKLTTFTFFTVLSPHRLYTMFCSQFIDSDEMLIHHYQVNEFDALDAKTLAKARKKGVTISADNRAECDDAVKYCITNESEPNS